MIADHWVAIKSVRQYGKIAKQRHRMISLELFTWGGTKIVTQRVDDFLRCYYGFLAVNIGPVSCHVNGVPLPF